MLSVHYYSPDAFALEEDGTADWGTQAEIAAMRAQIKKISEYAAEKGMPVFIGEYGPIDKNNTAQRAKYCYELNYYAGYYGNVVTAYWDNGVTGEYGTALFDRVNNTVTATGSTIISNIEDGMADGIDDQP